MAHVIKVVFNQYWIGILNQKYWSILNQNNDPYSLAINMGIESEFF